MRVATVAVLLILLQAYSALADDKRDLVLQLLEVTDAKRIHEITVQSYVAQFSKNATLDTPEFRAYFADVMSWNGLLEPTIEIYRETYTEEELRALIEFFRSPVGKSFVNKMPDVSTKCSAVLMARIQGALHHFKKN
jgi:hypothetical protein